MATAAEGCGFCFIEPVVGFCENCNIRLGERCFSNHTKIALFTGHIVFPLDNIESKEHLPVPIEKDIHTQKCQKHETDPQSFYCGKHGAAICGRCILADHMTCKDEIVDLHTVKFDEQKTNALLVTLKEIEGEINDLQVRVDENVKLNDECRASCIDAIKEYRKKIDFRLNQLQLVAEQATEVKHKENMDRLVEVAQICKDVSLRMQERGEMIEDLSKTKQERHLFVYSKKLAVDIDEIRAAIKQSNFKNHITQFTFKEHPTFENTLQKEILEIGTLQEACDGSEEIVEDVHAQVTDGNMYKGITKSAFLPNSVVGQNICRMLKVAFERKLVFTINSGGVIVYNDIDHCGSIYNRRDFRSYCPRVTAQLEAKGITLADIDTNDNFEGRFTVD